MPVFPRQQKKTQKVLAKKSRLKRKKNPALFDSGRKKHRRRYFYLFSLLSFLLSGFFLIFSRKEMAPKRKRVKKWCNETDTTIELKCITLRELKEFCEELKINKTLEEVNISFSSVGVQGAELLKDALKENTTMKSLTIRSIGLGKEGAGRPA